jgi:hypothetical protein
VRSSLRNETSAIRAEQRYALAPRVFEASPAIKAAAWLGFGGIGIGLCAWSFFSGERGLFLGTLVFTGFMLLIPASMSTYRVTLGRKGISVKTLLTHSVASWDEVEGFRIEITSSGASIATSIVIYGCSRRRIAKLDMSEAIRDELRLIIEELPRR